MVKRLDQRCKIAFKIYDVINWETNIYNTYITQYLKKLRQKEGKKIDPLVENNMTNIILEKTYAKCGGETTPTPIPKNKIKHIFGSTA